ncbi:glycosyl transferase family 90-domain-containing protein [Mycena galericulata]|nr:glycosyl transferase family 90-domain-containing protein [Mycena galericulata]
MAYDPEATVARPLLALTPSYQPHSRRRTSCLRRPYPRLSLPLLLAGGILVTLTLGGATTAYVRPDLARAAVPDRLASYYPGGGWGSGNAPPPAHDSPDRHPHPPGGAGAPGGAQGHAPLDADVPPPSSSHSQDDGEEDTPQLTALRASQPHTLSSARARYSLQTGRAPPRGYDEFFAFAQERECLVDARAYSGVFADFAPFWALEAASHSAAGSASSSNGVEAKEGAGWFRTRVRTVAQRLAAAPDKRGMTALQIKAGKVVRPDYQGTYFDGDWETTVNKFATALPDLTVLINGRDEPRVVFDVKPLLAASYASSSSSDKPPQNLTHLTSLTDPTPFALAPPSTAAFFATRPGCGGSSVSSLASTSSASSSASSGLGLDSDSDDTGGGGEGGVGAGADVSFILSASSAEFTTDLVPVLSMAKIVDVGSVKGGGVQAGQAGIGGGGGGGGHTCFADVVVPGEFYYRDSWWAGKFEYPDNVPWAEKRGVLYWRGKSNGGHIRGENYKRFPRFRLMDLAARPENHDLFDVRITGWHESHCTGALPYFSFSFSLFALAAAIQHNCDAEAIKRAYNISGMVVPREEAYQYKYLLDVDGNTFSGRYLGLLRSGGLVFKSTAFTEFFTPWLVPYEHFIPVRPDLADLPAKIEWARANDEEARRIQESGRVFAERVLTDAQNDCYWFAVMLEWGALWGED